MTDETQKLLDQVLSLAREERAKVATAILASLDGEPDDDWEATWLAELDRRVKAAAERGESGTDWSEARARILAQLGQ